MRDSRPRNKLETEIRELFLGNLPTSNQPISPTKQTPLSDVYREDPIDKWLREYHSKTEIEDSYYDDFVETYLSWREFSIPAIRALELTAPKSRGPTRKEDLAISQLWEKSLTVHRPKLQTLSERAEMARAVHAKRLGPLPLDPVDSPRSEASEVSSGSTLPDEFVV